MGSRWWSGRRPACRARIQRKGKFRECFLLQDPIQPLDEHSWRHFAQANLDGNFPTQHSRDQDGVIPIRKAARLESRSASPNHQIKTCVSSKTFTQLNRKMMGAQRRSLFKAQIF
jgi:hypothetical protein